MRRRALLGLALPVALALSGCASDDRDSESGGFPPLRYDYLTPLRLNVASIVYEDRFVPAPGGAASLSPVSPIQALEQMAHDRLRAEGASGRAVFIVDDASLVLVPGGLSGSMAVHLDILTDDGRRAGFAEARASQVYTGPTGNIRAVTYDLVRNMMDRMNVEFEYQLRRSLGDWLQVTETAPPPIQVQQQDLGPPRPLPPPR